jgi:hypothetical protein
VTADGLTVDGNATLQGASSPTLNITDTDTPTTAFISSTNSSARFGSSTNTDVFWMSNNTLRTQIDGATGDISFYDSSGSSQNLFWDASTSRLGLGTTSPSAPLSVKKASTGVADTVADFGNTAVANGLQVITSDGNLEWGFNALNSRSMVFQTNQTERLRIDSSGNVGIGVAAPAVRLQTNVANASTEAIRITNDADSVRTHMLPAEFQAQNSDLTLNAVDGFATVFKTTNTERMRIDSSGNVELPIGNDQTIGQVFSTAHSSGNVGSIGLTISDGGGHSGVFVNNTHDGTYSDQSITFKTAEGGVSSATERMRLTSAGSLLAGKTASAFGTAGVEINQNGVAGKVFMTRSGGDPLALNRLSSDGEIQGFYKDGTTVGSIGCFGGYAYVGSATTSDTFIAFVNSAIRPSTSAGAGRDNAIDLGQSGNRFKDIYAINSTIQTSDRNEKQDIEELSEAEQRVAVACKGLLRKFRWKDAVEEKGDDARIHFGIIAQDLQDAFTAEGLDAGRYGMFINSTWTDEETGEERSRMGVRYSELLAFIISAI